MQVRRFFVGGEARGSAESYAIRSPYDRAVVAEVARPSRTDLEDALEAARVGFHRMRSLPAWRRAEPLAEVSRRLAADRDRWARTIALEAGKPITQARSEVDRAAQTFRIASEEARRIGGEVLPLDGAPGGERRFGLTRRFPIGPVACITPFNFPLNLVAHKVAPALAAGCSFVLKPASTTPLSALDLAELLLEAGIPPEAVSVLPLSSAQALPLVEDPRTRALSFTGSSTVGWELRRLAYRKRVVLELGGNAGLIVDRSADLALAAARAVSGGFGYAGQSCISVQRIFAQRAVFDSFAEALVGGAAAQVLGDPLDDRTTVGPMISDGDAQRIVSWIEEAVSGGARVLHGGTRSGCMVTPTILTGTSPDMQVCRNEAFAPLVTVEPFDVLDDAIAAVDRSAYGLQAGIFTNDLAGAWAAFEGLEVGAVLVNETPNWRDDSMPYGGVKSSGMGREGPRHAIEDYTELRLLVLG